MEKEQLPLKAAELSAAHHLGMPHVAYPATVARSNGVYAVLAALLVGGLIWYSGRTGQQMWLLFAGGVLLLLGGLLASSLLVRYASLVVCTHGLLRIAGQHTNGIRWEEMREVWQNQQGFLTLTHPHGTPLVINATVRAWDQLAATVAQELLRVRLPEVWAQYQRGSVVRFGPVWVDQHGIHHARALLPWEEIGGMSQHAGLLLIQRADQHPWTWIALAEVPNLYLLEALLERVSQEKRKSNSRDSTQQDAQETPR